MPWYHVRLSSYDIAAGKHIRLQNAFTTLYLERLAPKGIAMFVNRDVKDDYTYYFSPQCLSFCTAVFSTFGASQCTPPSRVSVALLVGDAGAPGDLLRS